MGDGTRVWRGQVPSKNFSRFASWTEVTTDHKDPSDVAFDAIEFRLPISARQRRRRAPHHEHLARSWKLTGGGFGGFNALQINEITARPSPAPRRTSISTYSTQDNNIKAVVRRRTLVDCRRRRRRGTSLRTAPTQRQPSGHARDVVAKRGLGPAAHVPSRGAFPELASLARSAESFRRIRLRHAFLIVEDVYLQPAIDTTVTPTAFNYFLTQSAGGAWQPVFSLHAQATGTAGVRMASSLIRRSIKACSLLASSEWAVTSA
jgi:hypothetical protein